MIITGEGTYVRCTPPWENIGGPDCANGPSSYAAIKCENFVLVEGFRTVLNLENRLFFSFSVFVLHYNRGSKSRVQNRKQEISFSVFVLH